MKQEAYFCRVKELNELGKENIPKQLISYTHLIYSSPATLAFNSPGAENRSIAYAASRRYNQHNELRSVCDVIHQDCDKEQPKVVFDNELNLVARQYDPSLILVLDRNFILYRAGSTVVGNYENSKA